MGAFRTLFFLLLVAPAVAGCDTPVEGRNFPEIGFSHQAPIALNVASIEVKKPPPGAVEGSVLSELPVTPAEVAERWARERLKPVGTSGTAVVTIEKASLIEERLRKTGGVRGAFTTDQTERYVGELALAVSIVEPGGEASAKARATRTRTIPEGATLAEREKLWFDIVESLGRNIDKVMEEQIEKHMTAYLR